ncbi:protein of unknown function [Shinella sp. WSC3-e]|nr:hypothetical protein SHINE37_42428 [Rhizobiaceae bacterium]CAK7257014.1 protein of unknown function [Shinella sp. WSC3-e]
MRPPKYTAVKRRNCQHKELLCKISNKDFRRFRTRFQKIPWHGRRSATHFSLSSAPSVLWVHRFNRPKINLSSSLNLNLNLNLNLSLSNIGMKEL